jgi:hypothetical protein
VAQIMIWFLKKVASIALETIAMDLVMGRMRNALSAGPGEERAPVAELPAAERAIGHAVAAPVDPAILLIAEMIAAALEQQGIATHEAILADGRAHPNISILVVAQQAQQSPEIVDATVVPVPPPADEIADAA